MGQQRESIARWVATRRGRVDSGFDHDGIAAVRAPTRGFFRGDELLRPRRRILWTKSCATAEGCREVRPRFLPIRTHHPLACHREEESCCSGSLQDFAQRLQHEQAVGDTFRWVILVFPAAGQGPGTKAHVARGNPLTVDVRSTNYIPLVMEAHQSLAAAIPSACCREIQVTIENHDNAPGVIALGSF